MPAAALSRLTQKEERDRAEEAVLYTFGSQGGVVNQISSQGEFFIHSFCPSSEDSIAKGTGFLANPGAFVRTVSNTTTMPFLSRREGGRDISGIFAHPSRNVPGQPTEFGSPYVRTTRQAGHNSIAVVEGWMPLSARMEV